MMTKLRRRASISIAGHKRGRCLHAVLQATLGTSDPSVQLRRDVFTEWFRMWIARPYLHGRIAR
eukprot:2502861-Pyramimonas_sp.AAC.1